MSIQSRSFHNYRWLQTNKDVWMCRNNPMRSFPNLGNKHACFKMPEHLCLYIWNREKGEQPDTSESDCCCKKDQKTLCIGPTACLLRPLSTSNQFPLTFIILATCHLQKQYLPNHFLIYATGIKRCYRFAPVIS